MGTGVVVGGSGDVVSGSELDQVPVRVSEKLRREIVIESDGRLIVCEREIVSVSVMGSVSVRVAESEAVSDWLNDSVFVSVGGAVRVMVSVPPVGDELFETVTVPESDDEIDPNVCESLTV